MNFADLLLHTDVFVSQMATLMGPWLYVVLFLILFCETGLVITPFLPGDSLLFAVGAMTTLQGGALSLTVLSVILPLAVFLGDNVNYYVGRQAGTRIFQSETSRLFNRSYLEKAHLFYERWGARAVIIARFAPIVRTFVPFVAGIARMSYTRFLVFSVVGSLLWIQMFLWAGHIFGNLPAVKTNFHLVIFGVILLSLLPILIGVVKARREKALS